MEKRSVSNGSLTVGEAIPGLNTTGRFLPHSSLESFVLAIAVLRSNVVEASASAILVHSTAGHELPVTTGLTVGHAQFEEGATEPSLTLRSRQACSTLANGLRSGAISGERSVFFSCGPRGHVWWRDVGHGAGLSTVHGTRHGTVLHEVLVVGICGDGAQLPAFLHFVASFAASCKTRS